MVSDIFLASLGAAEEKKDTYCLDSYSPS